MSIRAEQDAVREEIERVCNDIDVVHRPSPHQYLAWRAFVAWGDGCDPDGYFLGQCPFNNEHLARFSFLKGVLRCDDGCMERPTISLTNAMMRLATK